MKTDNLSSENKNGNNANTVLCLGFSSDYKRQVPPFKQRLIAILHILFDRNFVLITGITEFIRDGQKGRILKTIRRTDYGGESDYLSCLGGAEMCRPKTEA